MEELKRHLRVLRISMTRVKNSAIIFQKEIVKIFKLNYNYGMLHFFKTYRHTSLKILNRNYSGTKHYQNSRMALELENRFIYDQITKFIHLLSCSCSKTLHLKRANTKLWNQLDSSTWPVSLAHYKYFLYLFF